MKSYFNIKLFFTLVVATVLITSCDKDNTGTTEQEVITTINFFAKVNSGPTFKFAWRDLDGDGGNAPQIDTIRLLKDSTYTFETQVLDETQALVKNISDAIHNNQESHIFIYKPGTNNFSMEITDKDKNGNKIGLVGNILTQNAGKSTLQIILRHLPTDKTASDPGGETDIDVSFPVVIE